MKLVRHTGLFLLAALLISGCASTGGTWDKRRENCTIGGGLVGAGLGAVRDSGAGAAGAVAGAIFGSLLCRGKDTDRDGVRDEDDRCPGTPAGVEVDQNGCEPDFDGDGVPDRLDECSDTPSGAQVDARGCELDSDGDGVVNSKDRCPNTPAGAPVDANGCELDSDGDGVGDSRDECPDTPAGTTVDNRGCTLAPAYELEGVRFDFDSARLTPDSKASLDDAVKILERHSELQVEIAGHTDSIGSETYNQGLSERRARAVRDYLVAHGIDAGRLTVRGYGETEPVADNATRVGRAANRRVEMRHE